MDKYYNIQVVENCDVGLAGKHLDIRFHVPAGLTQKQIDELNDIIQGVMSDYGEANYDDYSDMDYNELIETALNNLGIKHEYPKVDYTLYI